MPSPSIPPPQLLRPPTLPALPALSPGVSHVWTLTASFTLGVSVDSFDAAAQQTFKVNLADQLHGISVADIELSVEAGSLVLTVQICVPSREDADRLFSPLSSAQLINGLGAALGYSIEAASVPLVVPVVLSALSPPPSNRGASDALIIPNSNRDAGDRLTIIVVTASAASAVICGIAGAFVMRRRRRRAKRAESGHRAVQPSDIPSLVGHPGNDQTSSTLLSLDVDQILVTTHVKRLHPMLRRAQQWIVHAPGVLRAHAGADIELRITKSRIYLEQAIVAGANGVVEQWPLRTLASVKRIRHEMRNTALELTMVAQQGGQLGGSVLFDFNSRDDRERVVQILQTERPQLVPPDEDLQAMTEKWHEGEIDNYTYLLHVNECASRSFTDLLQYPIMCALANSQRASSPLSALLTPASVSRRPWVLSDYRSESLDLDNPHSFRPLWKPVGAPAEQRLAGTGVCQPQLQRYAGDEVVELLYHTHNLSPAHVAYYLSRIFPMLTHHIQSGSDDQPSCTFVSVEETWQNVSVHSNGDRTELIPQFYSDASFLIETTGDVASPVVLLPPWANGSASEFVRLMRAALESEFVSAHLHLWIDLVFGNKQLGGAALAADNLLHPNTYAGGQTPPQLFQQPHCPRRHTAKRAFAWRAAQPTATAFHAELREISCFLDDFAVQKTGLSPSEQPALVEVLRQMSSDLHLTHMRTLKNEYLKAEAAPRNFAESCTCSNDLTSYNLSERHPFYKLYKEFCDLVIRLFDTQDHGSASGPSAEARVVALSDAVQLGLTKVHDIIASSLPPPVEERSSSKILRALVLDEITSRLLKRPIMPCIRDVHCTEDAIFAERTEQYAGLRPNHFGSIALPRQFWLASADDTSNPPYDGAIRLLHFLPSTYSSRRKLNLLSQVLESIQQHVWIYHGISSPEDQTLGENQHLILETKHLLLIVVYVLSQSSCTLYLCSELAFIEHFSEEGSLRGKQGGYLKIFEDALSHLCSLSLKDLHDAGLLLDKTGAGTGTSERAQESCDYTPTPSSAPTRTTARAPAASCTPIRKPPITAVSAVTPSPRSHGHLMHNLSEQSQRELAAISPASTPSTPFRQPSCIGERLTRTRASFGGGASTPGTDAQGSGEVASGADIACVEVSSCGLGQASYV